MFKIRKHYLTTTLQVNEMAVMTWTFNSDLIQNKLFYFEKSILRKKKMNKPREEGNWIS